ncbi:SGNH/GDSL hydrolase family protein [Streptomyces sp. LN549]|uniref:SGNH/GDSL hydrolase family protein n=1 Tax=Streptomyces sp. LN549 TaxID=3112979 RepID=UPI00371AF24B
MRKTSVAALVTLGLCVSAAVPAAVAAPAAAPAAAPVPTVFIGDSYTANFGISPAGTPATCFRATENYPAKAAEQLASAGTPLDVQADVSCGAAQIHHVWRPQPLPPFGLESVPAQITALKPDTKLVVGSMGGNTLGFANIMKQCSERLRGNEGLLLPAEPVDASQPASECATFFKGEEGADWLNHQFGTVFGDLHHMIDEIKQESPDARIVLVGYPRIVPADTTKCLSNIPGGTEKPLADIEQDALKFLDTGVQKPLNDLMKEVAEDAGAAYTDLYSQTGSNTACDGARRGIGAMLETSEAEFSGIKLPWYVHPNRTGRDIQAAAVADTIGKTLASQ